MNTIICIIENNNYETKVISKDRYIFANKKNKCKEIRIYNDDGLWHFSFPLKYDTIMRTNKKNKEALSKRCNENSINSKNKQVRTGVKNGRYAGTKERFTGWMFNVYHKEKTICIGNNCYQKLSDPKKRHVHLCLPLANRTRINKN